METITLGFIAIIVNLIVSFIKNKFGTNTYKTMASLLVLSIISAAIYIFIKDTKFLNNLLEILKYSAIFYSFIQNPLSKINNEFKIL